MKYVSLVRVAKGWDGNDRDVCIALRYRVPRETWFLSFRRVYGSRAEAKRDLRRARKFEPFEGAKIVEVTR